jgi:hypothetical protein
LLQRSIADDTRSVAMCQRCCHGCRSLLPWAVGATANRGRRTLLPEKATTATSRPPWPPPHCYKSWIACYLLFWGLATLGRRRCCHGWAALLPAVPGTAAWQMIVVLPIAVSHSLPWRCSGGRRKWGRWSCKGRQDGRPCY